jgi:hypothetical protein
LQNGSCPLFDHASTTSLFAKFGYNRFGVQEITRYRNRLWINFCQQEFDYKLSVILAAAVIVRTEQLEDFYVSLYSALLSNLRCHNLFGCPTFRTVIKANRKSPKTRKRKVRRFREGSNPGNHVNFTTLCLLCDKSYRTWVPAL